MLCKKKSREANMQKLTLMELVTWPRKNWKRLLMSSHESIDQVLVKMKLIKIYK